MRNVGADYSKVYRTITSCKTAEQLCSASKLMVNFLNLCESGYYGKKTFAMKILLENLNNTYNTAGYRIVYDKSNVRRTALSSKQL